MSITTANEISTSTVKGKQKRKGLASQEARLGYLFLTPWILGFLVFTMIPMVSTLVISFTNYSLNNVNNLQFVGLRNYAKLFSDPIVPHAMSVTLRFFAMALPIAIFLPLGLAALMNSKHLWGKRIFRTLFYMPYMIPLVSAVLAWGGFLNEQTGWMNRFLALFGIPGPEWIRSTTWIYPALLLFGLWGNGQAMITMLAGMQNVPTDMYEAARVDGANNFTIFWKITVPMVSPIIFYNLILAVVGLFQYFLEPYVLTRGTGDPGNATMFYNLYMFKNFFQYQDMAYGATLAWVLFLAILTVTLIIFGTRRFWVYEAERS